MTSIEWLIARRYLFSRERKALVTLISLISMAGVAVGVAALLIVIGVIDGVDELLFSNISALYPHVRIKGADGAPLVFDQALMDRLKARSDVVLAQPVIEKEALLQRNVNGEVMQRGIRLIGMSVLGPGTLYPAIYDKRTGGQVKLGPGEILAGAPLFMELGLAVDEPVQVVTTAVIKTALYNTFRVRREKAVGYFSTRLYDFNASTAFVAAEEIRDLYRMPPGTADYIFIKLKDPFTAARVKGSLALPAGYAVSTWNEENGDFFGALKLERLGLWLILLLIVIVAALNIIGTLILMVIEKTREVGTLRAIGASERLVARIFLVDGMMIGVVGTLAGLAIGIGVCLLIPRIDIQLPAAVLFDHLPVKIRPLTVALVTGASLVICTLAALFPARKAARLNPVEALRYD